ncbi:hypothetical protein PCASD_15405 [Puccinia coronata f. sp. avenae]|uniref:Uncharacterized protein n=1 Tax=Puccinia coronata f. sp. avenae TaxID=200324 RepID=A0A2N5TZ86_9BASI|nr:hypothetical protein PCASD_15405 [Puccinia coronata f. sp. avenae]
MSGRTYLIYTYILMKSGRVHWKQYNRQPLKNDLKLNQPDGNPHKRTIWTPEDKKDLEIFDYRPHVPLPDTDQHWLLFQSDFGKEYACAPNYQKTRRKHPELSLTLMRSAVDQVPEHQVLRISYLNAPGKLLPSDVVRARQRMLLAYLYKLHQRVLARCDHLTDSTKDWLHDSLFKWIHRNLFQPQAEPYLLPIIGIVHDTQLTWENMAATYRFTQTQKDLLTYFSDGTKEAVVTATLKLVQTFTDQHKGETAYKWAGRFGSASLVLQQNKRGLSSCPPECCRFCNCANVHMRQANVPSISPLSATTRPLRMYSPVRFWLCLLAYLLVSSVAIALASPSWAERPRSFDLNSYPDQDGNPQKRTIWIPEDKEDLEKFVHRTHMKLPEIAHNYCETFKRQFGEEFGCESTSRKSNHPTLPLSLMLSPSKSGQVAQYLLLRIRDAAETAKGNLVSPDIVHDSKQNDLHSTLFKWIHHKIFEPKATASSLPVIGMLPDTSLKWESMEATDRFTKPQKELARYLSEGTDNAAVSASLNLVEMHENEHPARAGSQVVWQHKYGPVSCSAGCRIFHNCANINMGQVDVHSIPPLNTTTTRPLKICSSARFWPCLLAYLLFSSVAIVLAKPSLTGTSRGLDLNLFPPRERKICTPEDKAALDALRYSPQRALNIIPDAHYVHFSNFLDERYKCVSGYHSKYHPTLPLALWHPEKSSEYKVLRIKSWADATIVRLEEITARYRRLLAHLYSLQEKILARKCYRRITNERKDQLHHLLYNWIFQEVFIATAPHLPLIGIVKKDATWENLPTTYEFTEAQVELAKYLAKNNLDAAVEASQNLFEIFADQRKEAALVGQVKNACP